MKVLSLTEPFATLILNGKKSIETRSWKTSYRGELYIHASMTKMAKKDENNKELMKLLKDSQLNYGYIICKCTLVDCIYMTNEYIEEIKNNDHQEYICGEYSEGRYAWILKDIMPLEKKVKAKGQLNIWNYYDEFEIMNLMEDIKYGWIDKENNKYQLVDENFSCKYILQSPQEVIKNKLGVCWDQVELERYYFKGNNYNIKTFFLVHYDNDKCPTHTFLTFEKDNKYYWFEHSWEKFKGIHEYKTMKALLLDVRNKFIENELNNNYFSNNLVMCEYKKPEFNISVQEFYNHCEHGTYINLEKL